MKQFHQSTYSGYIAERADIADLCFRLQPVEEKGLERFLLCKLIFSFALSHIAFIFFAAAAPKQGNNPGASSPDGWQLNHQPKSIYPRNQGSLKKKNNKLRKGLNLISQCENHKNALV